MASFPFCTISTYSHLYKCFALADSISKWGGFLHVLCVDEINCTYENTPKNIAFHYLSDLNNPLSNSVVKKYSYNKDKLRWSLKSIFLLELLKTNDKVIYTDNDVAFFNDFSFLFTDLINHPVLLSPHYYPINPKKDQNWFEANFKVGLYNAGFIGANKNSKDLLTWWAEACLYRCEKNALRGLFDDQKYLDLFPIIEPQVKVLAHKGCNVAEWNNVLIKRNYINGKHLVNNNELLIFYHFSNYSLSKIDKKDPLFTDYLNIISKYKRDLKGLYLPDKLSLTEILKLSIWKIFNKFNS